MSSPYYLPEGLVSEGISAWSLDTFNITLPASCFLCHSEELLDTEVVCIEISNATLELYVQRAKTKPQSLIGASGTKYVMLKDRRTGERLLRLELSSKSLKERYLQGICLDTLPLLYEVVKEDGIVTFSYEDLLLQPVTDFDYQRLYVWEHSLEFLCDYYRRLKASYFKSEDRGRYLRLFTEPEKNNVGFYVNERRHSKSIVSAHIKSYYKWGEMLSKDEDMMQFITAPEALLKKVHRQELTVSGKAQAKALGLSGTTLSELIRMPQDLISGAYEAVMDANFNPHLVKKAKSSQKLTVRQELLYIACHNLLRDLHSGEGRTIQEVRDYFLQGEHSSRQRKSKVNKDLTLVLDLLLQEGLTGKPISEHSPDASSEIKAMDLLTKLFGR